MEDKQWKYLTLQREGRVLEVSFQSDNKVNSLNNALMRELTQLAQLLDAAGAARERPLTLADCGFPITFAWLDRLLGLPRV